MVPGNLSTREKAVVCGLFLSKFDKDGLALLGFTSFSEAFNVLGISLGVRPASIKNYRDEFDPYFPNARKGWHNRPLREYCGSILDAFRETDLYPLASIVARITSTAIPSEEPAGRNRQSDESFAKRLLTGQAAENYFVSNYQSEPAFVDSELIDVTFTGCGYDFQLVNKLNKSKLAVEVKGIASTKGQVLLSAKEHDVAATLKDSYYLYVVKNFDDRPYASVIANPLASTLAFVKRTETISRITWSAAI